MNKSDYLYDAMSSQYQNVSNKRRKYIFSINELIYKHCAGVVNSYLDAGCGDGIRSSDIQKKIQPNKTVLIDSSIKMIELSRKNTKNSTCVHSSIEDFTCDNKFDLITCLWNVFGHIESEEKRIKSLINLRKLLSNDGLLMIDINNRYNLYYTYKEVLKNIFFSIQRKESNNWHTFDFNGKKYQTYISSYFEMKRCIRNAGLDIVYKYGVDYEDGKLSSNYLTNGQVFFVLKKK
ncbi:class I SAM-dependent methyltransferase [bacterium]|nr:class I SAM-dependent methyltransferase [bacterium]